MAMIDEMLTIFNIDHKSRKSDDVNPTLSTFLSIIHSEKYIFGRFIEKYTHRIEIVDDFRMDGAACAQYIPSIRKLRIVTNPLILWDVVLRSCLLSDKDYDKTKIQEIDRILINAFKDNGWTEPNFKLWIDFLNEYSFSGFDHKKYNENINDDNLSNPLSSVFVHEFLHCTWCHCNSPRRYIDDKTKMFGHVLTNIAMDFAINQSLYFGKVNPKFMTTDNIKLLKAFISGGAPLKCEEYHIPNIDVFETKFLNQPYEYYYNILKNADENLLEELVGKNNLKSTMFDLKPEDLYDLFKHKLDELSEEDLEKLKSDLGITSETQEFEDFNPTPTDIKRISNNDIKRVIDDMIRKGEINNPEDALKTLPFNYNESFGKMIEGFYKTPTMPWDHILRHEIIKTIGQSDFDYTMKRESRSIENMFPGKMRENGIDLNLVEDVSGSINKDDFTRFRNEMIRATREVDTPTIRYIQFHHEISLDTMIPISKIKSIGIRETGGTSMKVPLDLLKKEGNTKTTIVFTDGWVDTGYTQNDFPFKVIIFVSASGNQNVCEELSERGFTVISQDGDNSWYN